LKKMFTSASTISSKRIHANCMVLVVALVPFMSCFAADDMAIKLATVAPKGSIYHRKLQEVGAAWAKAQGGDSRFVIYTDGIQGTESNTVRRLRIGQLDGAMYSVAGLKEIEPSIAALQLMPLVFRSWEEFDYVHQRLRADLEVRLLEKGFVTLFWAEGGWVQFFSTVPRIAPADFKSARLFAWAGTPAQVDIMKSMGYQPVVLELSDVLAALQTGMIDAIPAAPMWALAFQMYGTTSHMVRVNWVPIIGAIVVTRRAWEQMKPQAQEALLAVSTRVEAELRDYRSVQDNETVAAMVARGLVVHEPTQEIAQEWQDIAQSVWPRLRGSMVPAETFDRVLQLLNEFRASNQ
jgi:TRAP-type transport system periplasmic protein